MSIAGGVRRSVDRAAAYGMTALQIFTRSSRAWRCPPLDPDDADEFRARVGRSRIGAVAAHATYLVNPASPDRALRLRSERALVDELTRSERLGIPWLVLHPGSHSRTTAAAGIRRAGAALSRVLRATEGFRAGILVENAAGQGDAVGRTLGEVGAILAAAGDGDRMGACIDTCHAFAAGMDLRTAEGWSSFRDDLEREIGFGRVRVIHVNDSEKPLGSRVDRHAGLGKGEMGLAPFRRLVSDPVLGRLPLILETPKEGPDGEDMDAENLGVLRRLAREPA